MLAQRWWAQLPAPLPRDGVDLAASDPDWPWRPVVVVEVTPCACVIRPEWAAPAEQTLTVTLPVPVGEVLSAESE